MAMSTAAGASLAIATTSGPPATLDAAGYGAMTYTVVGEITNIGEFGREYAVVNHQPLATRGAKKLKGSYNNGTLSPALALDNDDAGQTAMSTALNSDAAYAFRVTTQSGDSYYMMGKVTSFKVNIGGADDVITASPTIELDSEDIVLVAAP